MQNHNGQLDITGGERIIQTCLPEFSALSPNGKRGSTACVVFWSTQELGNALPRPQP